MSDEIWDARQQVLLRGWTQIDPSSYSLSWLMSVERVDVVPVPAPEPGTAALLGLGIAGLAQKRRRRSG